MSLDNALASLPTTMMFWTGVPSHWDSPDSIGNSLILHKKGVAFCLEKPLTNARFGL